MSRPYVVTCRGCSKEFFSDNQKQKYHARCLPAKKTWTYPRKFYHMRTSVWIRDNITCQDCGRDLRNEQRNPPIHHIDGDIKNNEATNLVLLCINCHRRIHRTGLKKFNVSDFHAKDVTVKNTKRVAGPFFRGI